MGAGARTGIYRLTREWSTYFWLCADHVATRIADRWQCERIGDVDGDCGDCVLGKPKMAM
jgi:hypothetical protein